MKKVAIFVDWDNLRKTIVSIQAKQRRNRSPLQHFNYNDSSHIAALFSSFLEPMEEIYRIFFYTAKPMSDADILANLRTTNDQQSFQRHLAGLATPNASYIRASEFLKNIVKEDYIALRTGKLQVRGVDGAGKPDLVQKQVDMLIGLDIADVSYNKHADSILVFSKDTDMIPALKTARINGLNVMVANFDEYNYISPDIITHSDLIRKRSLVNIDNTL